jgi:hypothetical protein
LNQCDLDKLLLIFECSYKLLENHPFDKPLMLKMNIKEINEYNDNHKDVAIKM